MKKILSCISTFLCILVLFSILCPVLAADDEETVVSDTYTVDAKAAMLIDLDTGRSLFEQNADEQIYPASLTKIMTCLIALENGNLDDVVTVPESAFDGLDSSSSSAGLLVGEELPLRELLYCMMVASANEACNTVAEYLFGSVENFVAEMNRRAAEIGCTGTHFANPHGLHDENHYTTARDLSLIVQEALKNDTFVLICTTTEHVVPATNLSEERELYTTNYLISTHSTSNYYYSKARGIKTGFTTPAGRCLISMASSDGLNLLSVVCGADTVVLDSGELWMKSFPETRNLFEYGFSSFSQATLVSPLEPLGQLSVSDAATTDSAVYAPASEITALLPTDYDESAVERVITLDSPEGISAPVAKDQKLGTVSVYYKGEFLGETDLLAIAEIPRSEMEHVATQTANFFQSSTWHWILRILLLILAALILFVLIRLRLRMAERKRRAAVRRRNEMLRRMHEGEDQ